MTVIIELRCKNCDYCYPLEYKQTKDIDYFRNIDCSCPNCSTYVNNYYIETICEKFIHRYIELNNSNTPKKYIDEILNSFMKYLENPNHCKFVSINIISTYNSYFNNIYCLF